MRHFTSAMGTQNDGSYFYKKLGFSMIFRDYISSNHWTHQTSESETVRLCLIFLLRLQSAYSN